jgi:pseudaminic acid cytidylyltransferase
VARSLGAETPFVRPATLSDDHTGTNPVVRHALEWFAARGCAYEHACCLYATAPFVHERYLREGWQALTGSDRAFAFSVTTFAFAVQRALALADDGSVRALYPEFASTRSQDLQEAFHYVGEFCWGRARDFVAGTPLFAPGSVGVRLPRHLVQDIDTDEDWRRAEHMYRALQAAGELPA